ncbi:MAG: hypothetical protein ACYTEZ_19085 [Planctomycetota bacterium]|jgi:hypothetical protein
MRGLKQGLLWALVAGAGLSALGFAAVEGLMLSESMEADAYWPVFREQLGYGSFRVFANVLLSGACVLGAVWLAAVSPGRFASGGAWLLVFLVAANAAFEWVVPVFGPGLPWPLMLLLVIPLLACLQARRIVRRRPSPRFLLYWIDLVTVTCFLFVLSRAAWWIAGRWWFHWDPVIHGSSVLVSSLAILAAALAPVAFVHATLSARMDPTLQVERAQDG